MSNMFERLHHMQLAMPPGQEATARDFYAGVLGMTEIDKPPVLAARGGAWFRADSVELHLGVEDDFRAARKGHPGILVNDLDEVVDGFGPVGSRPSGTATSRVAAGFTRTTRSATASSSSSRSHRDGHLGRRPRGDLWPWRCCYWLTQDCAQLCWRGAAGVAEIDLVV